MNAIHHFALRVSKWELRYVQHSSCLKSVASSWQSTTKMRLLVVVHPNNRGNNSAGREWGKGGGKEFPEALRVQFDRYFLFFFFLARATTTIGSMAKSWIRLLCAKRRSRCIVCSSGGFFVYVYAKIECVPTVLCTAAIDSKMRWKKRRSSGCWIDRALYELHWTFKGKEEENADE